MRANAAGRPWTGSASAETVSSGREGDAGSRLQVLLLSLEYTPRLSGGMGTQVQELSRGLARTGHEVTVFACAPAEPGVLRRPGETVHLIPAIPSDSRGPMTIAQGILEFNRALVESARERLANGQRRPHVIHYHNWATYPAARRLSELFEVPNVGTIHFVAEPIERWWGQIPDPEIVAEERRLFAEAEHLVAVSRSLRKVVRSTYDLGKRFFRVVHNGLDPRPFMSLDSRPEERRRLRRAVAGEDEKLVLFAGRMNPQKGIEALLAAAARVAEAFPRVRYLVAGEPDSRGFGAELERLRRRYPVLEERMDLLGKLPRRQLASLYQVADLAVVPSVYEPFGYAAIEAMAAAVPVVATRVGGLAEIVEEGRSGLLVPVRRDEPRAQGVDVESLAESQLRLLGDDGLAREMGRAARKRVLSRFGVEPMVSAMAGVYREAAASMEGSSRAAAPSRGHHDLPAAGGVSASAMESEGFSVRSRRQEEE